MKEFQIRNKAQADIIKMEKRANDFSQEKIAETMHVKRQKVMKWENGDTYPTLEESIELCKVLDCDLEYLLGRCDKYHRETIDISEATGLSIEAADRLREWKSILFGEHAHGSADNFLLEIYGLKTLDSLLTNKEGLEMLNNVALYLHGRFEHITPNEDSVRENDGDSFDKAKKSAFMTCEERARFNKRYVVYEIEGSKNIRWTMDTDYFKSIFLLKVQESLVKLKDQIKTAQKGLD